MRPDDSRKFFPTAALDQLAMIEKERKELEASKPDFPRAMGVMDGPKPADQAINLRGSHWTLGPIVPRGFLHAITVKNPPVIPEGQAAGCSSPSG